MSEMGLDLSVPVGVSGAFLCDRARFYEIRELLTEFDRSNSRLSEVEYGLLCCNDPQWLAKFEGRCRQLNRDLEQELVKRAESLEAEKKSLTERIAELRQKLLALEPSALQVHTTLVGPSILYPQPLLNSGPRKERNAAVAARNAAIDCYLQLPNDLAICEALDDEFPPTKDRPAPQFPDPWFQKFGVKSFVEAYYKCPHLVHTLIGKRRTRQSP